MTKTSRLVVEECGKTGYHSAEAAKQGAIAVARANGDRRMPVYLCDTCHLYHLTSKGRGL